MALPAGTQVGPYQIVEQIGSGGMGEVCRATDTKLGRDVAIKTLPSALAQEPDRLARFEREAKLLATLNHAHIGAIYGLDEYEGTQFIAMELVEGQTLEERLRDGALPTEDALRIGLQIAEALEAAHEKGVVHRDLKPANIMLTPDGVVKVLDFGLAKAFSGDPNQASPAHSPALSVAMTQHGLILGTAGYMSPEQASGQATDQRADIWSFGVVLYEMLTGLPLFSGESVPHILADVLRTEPDWSRLPKDLHPRLRLLLERCLEKKVRNRYHSIADVRVDIQKVLGDPQGLSAVEVAVRPAQPIWRRALPAATAAVVAATIAAFAVWLAITSAPQSVKRFAYDLPAAQVFSPPGGGGSLVVLSPDGTQFAYATSAGLYLRRMDSLAAQLVPGSGTEVVSPVFSPDGRWIVYWSYNPLQLERVAADGGTPVRIAATDAAFGGVSWAADDTILFGQNSGIYRLPANGGAAELLIPSPPSEGICCATLLPGGDSVLFGVTTAGEWDQSGQIVAQSLSTGERTVIVQGGHDARYLPTGHLLYVAQGVLYAVRFNLETLSVSGIAVPVVPGIFQTSSGNSAAASYDVSPDGTLVYVPANLAGSVQGVFWADREGEEPLAVEPRSYASPRISPDGTKLALNERGEAEQIWILDFKSGAFTPLLGGADRFPVWSPDGKKIAYSRALQNLYWRAADGSGEPELLAHTEGQSFPTAFSPDGTSILVYGNTGASDDISIFRFEDRSVIPLLNGSYNETMPAISPDGRWLAYVSDQSGREEVYVRAFPDVDTGFQLVSRTGGTQPLWWRSNDDPNDQRLYYRDSAGALVRVAVTADTTLHLERPEAVLRGQYTTALGGRTYDVSPDGERFLVLREDAGNGGRRQVVVVLNWFDELNRLVPTN